MINISEMKKCMGKNVKIVFTDGDIWENKFCDCYHQAEDEDEEPMLEFGNTVIYQSEIKSIEILD